MRVAFIALYVIIWAGFLTFTVSYVWLTGGLIRGGWRKSLAGVLIAALGATCTGVLTLGLLRLVWPQMPFFVPLIFGGYGSLALVIWGLVALVWIRQGERVRKGDKSREVQV